MSVPTVGIGIIGYGLMGKAHTYGYTVAPCIRTLPCRPQLRVISGRTQSAVERAAQMYGVDRAVCDWRRVLDSPDVDIVDICTPPGTHPEIVDAASTAGKAIVCEKPLAADYSGARVAVEAVARAGVKNAIAFNLRRLPALSLMKQLIDDGRIGEPRLLRAIWLTDEFVDAAIPFDWRFDHTQGGSTIADLGAHLIDLAGWMVGPIASVSAQSRTFNPTRPDANGDAPHVVNVDDASSALFQFESGAIGVFETTKACPGRPCDLVLEVNGPDGSLRFDYQRLNELWYGAAQECRRAVSVGNHSEDGGVIQSPTLPETPLGSASPELYGMRRLRAEHSTHPGTQGWWPIGQGIGWDASFVNQAADLLQAWPDGDWAPNLAVGLEVQAACEAIERAAAERRWVDTSEIAGEATA